MWSGLYCGHQARSKRGRSRMDESSSRDYVMLIVAMAFWGGSWVSAKVVVGVAPPMTIGFFRFFTASILFILVMLGTRASIRRLFSRKNLRILFLVGLTGVFAYGVLFLTGMRFTTAAQGSIIAGFNPVTVSLFAHLIHKERLPRVWQYSGYLIAFLGVIFVVGIQALLDFRIEHLIGNLVILAAMFTWGLYTSVGKEAMKELSALEINAGGAVVGSVLFGLGAIYERVWELPALVDPVFWLNALYLGCLVTFVGFLFYFSSITRIGASRAGGFINLVPVFGVLFSALLLPGEPIYWTFIVGLALVVLGITLVNVPARNSTANPQSKET
ncbi:DMT family transporter [Candidatus Thorarchaeota archaeon]|nr:MAG: DMT family transporter [Candidatus Thorarchaeota archaeon]